MKEKHLLLNRSAIIESEGKFYVPESKIPGFIIQQRVLPIYFVSTSTSRVYFDSPVIGSEEFGPSQQDSIKGPFFDLEEAQKTLEKRGEEIDRISYEFSGKIISRTIPIENDLPLDIPIFRYYLERCELTAGPEPAKLYPRYNISNEQVELLYKQLRLRAEDRTKETKSFEEGNVKGLIALIKRGTGTSLIRLSLNERGPVKSFVIKSFSDEKQFHNYTAELRDLSIHDDAWKRYSQLELLGLSSVDFSVNDCLENIPKKNNLIS